MKIAKNSFNFDKKLPELGKKNLSLEGQIAKLSTLKADSKSINKHFSKIEKLISNNANQDKTTLQAIERINRQNLAAIKKNRVKFDKTTEQIKEKTKLLEEETKLLEENFSAKLMELSDFEVQIGELRKDISLLDKKYNKIDQSYNEQTDLEQKTNQKINDLETLLSTATKKLDKQLKTLNQKLSANISRIQKDIDHISQAASKPSQPQPQINIDSSNQEGIKQESLKQ